MASRYIKDPETAALVARVAKRSGMTKTALVRELAAAREAELERGKSALSPRERMERFWREHDVPPWDGPELSTDKAFFDDLSGNVLSSSWMPRPLSRSSEKKRIRMC